MGGRASTEQACHWHPPELRTHRAVLADALAALDGLLVTQEHLLVVERAQLEVHAKVVVEEAAGAVLGLGAASVLARTRLAVVVQLAELVCGGRGGERGLGGLLGRNRPAGASRCSAGRQSAQSTAEGTTAAAHSLQQHPRQPLLMPPQSMSVSLASLMPLLHVAPKVHTLAWHWLLWQSLANLQDCEGGERRDVQICYAEVN